MSSFRASLSSGKRHLLIFVITLFSFGFISNAQLLENDASKGVVSLTCTFSEDISKKKQAFRLVDEQQDNALQCQWKEEALYCTLKYGYAYDWKWSDTVTVRKLLSQEPEPATCSCFLDDHDGTSYERPCDVTVSVREFTRASSKETSRHPGDIRSHDSSTRPSEDSFLKPVDSRDNALVITVVTCCIVVTLLVILTVIVTVICKRYSFNYCGLKKCLSTKQPNPEDPKADEKRSLQDFNNLPA